MHRGADEALSALQFGSPIALHTASDREFECKWGSNGTHPGTDPGGEQLNAEEAHADPGGEQLSAEEAHADSSEAHHLRHRQPPSPARLISPPTLLVVGPGWEHLPQHMGKTCSFLEHRHTGHGTCGGGTRHTQTKLICRGCTIDTTDMAYLSCHQLLLKWGSVRIWSP